MSKVFTAINGAKWKETVNVEELGLIKNPSLGNRHVPVNHGEVLAMFRAKADQKGMTLGEQCGFLSPETDRFIFVAEVQTEHDLAYSIGFINFNDRSRSYTGLAGERVFACSNLSFGGVFAPSRTRHTTLVGDRIEVKVDSIFSHFQQYVDDMKSSMGFLKQTELDDAALGNVLVKLHRAEIFGATNVQRILEEFDNPTFNSKDEPSNGWRLFNAITHVSKRIANPIVNIDTTNAARSLILKTLGY